MRNPWLQLAASPPFSLGSDAAAIEELNATSKPEHQVHLDLLPDPYIGSIAAPLVLLALNPGFGDADPVTHRNEAFRRRALDNLHQRDQPYPFYYLDPQTPGGGQRFWQSKLRQPIKECGLERVARSVVCFQFFPYHSRAYPTGTPRLPSQSFTFDSLREAIRAKRTVVVMRSWKLWCDAVPELATYDNVFRIRNPRNPAVSRLNCPDGFDAVLEVIAKHRD